MGAERTKKEQPKSLILAIPWPQELLEATTPRISTGIEVASNVYGCNEEICKARFIQVDLHFYQTIEQLQWMLFKHAHGDLWNILGSTIRPFGLTIDEVGLYLRIPEVEKENRKKAKILLTREPTEILDFLGLTYDGTQWNTPFPTFGDIFEYAATCRFFWVRPDQPSGENELDHEEWIGGEFEKTKLKSNDRRRMNQRPLFRQWIDEFLRKCREEGRFGESHFTRLDVRNESFARFRVQHEYEARLLEWKIQRQRETLWKDVIKASLPEGLDPMWRSCAASALKKIIMQGDESFGIWPSVSLVDRNGLYIEDNVRDFVHNSWEQIGDAAWQKNQEKYREHIKIIGAKHTASGGEKGDGDETNAGLSNKATVGTGGGT